MVELVEYEEAITSFENSVTIEVHWDFAKPGWCTAWIKSWEYEREDKPAYQKVIKANQRMNLLEAFELAETTAKKIDANFIGLKELKSKLEPPGRRRN